LHAPYNGENGASRADLKPARRRTDVREATLPRRASNGTIRPRGTDHGSTAAAAFMDRSIDW